MWVGRGEEQGVFVISLLQMSAAVLVCRGQPGHVGLQTSGEVPNETQENWQPETQPALGSPVRQTT